MPAIYVDERSVEAAEIDELGHVNNAVYLQWMQRAAIRHSAANGWDVDRYQQIHRGWIARAHTIEYFLPAFEGDEVRIATWVSGARRVVSWRRYRMYRSSDRALLAAAETKWAFVDFATLRPARVPQVFWQDFTIVDREEDVLRWLESEL